MNIYCCTSKCYQGDKSLFMEFNIQKTLGKHILEFREFFEINNFEFFSFSKKCDKVILIRGNFIHRFAINERDSDECVIVRGFDCEKHGFIF